MAVVRARATVGNMAAIDLVTRKVREEWSVYVCMEQINIIIIIDLCFALSGSARAANLRD